MESLHVNGISISPKKNFCIIKIWNNNHKKEDVKLLSEKLTFLKFRDMLILKRLHFCSYLVIQEALRRLSKAICVSKSFNQSWMEKCNETIVFFYLKHVTDLFRRRVAKVTCTKYRACAQKLVRGNTAGATIAPRQV